MVKTKNFKLTRVIPEDMKDAFISAMEKAIAITDAMTVNVTAYKPFKRHKYAKDITFDRLNEAIKKGLRKEAAAKERGDAYNEHEAYALMYNLNAMIYLATSSNINIIPAPSDVRIAYSCLCELEDHKFEPCPSPNPEKPMRRAPNGQDELAFTEPTDIVITDPCYFVPDSDWQASGYGESLPFHHITKPTGVGDWDCAVITDTGCHSGTFAADTGMCTVAALSDISRAYPDAFKNVRRDCYAIIRGFTGTVRVTQGDVDGELVIIGNGSVNFKTKITGLSTEEIASL